MRACEKCHGPGPCLWSNDHQDYGERDEVPRWDGDPKK